MRRTILTLCFLLLAGCGNQPEPPVRSETDVPAPQTRTVAPARPKTAKTVHVFVALCDNKSQGIVPVPETLGNGDDPRNNLYWGAMYGTKSFLKKSKAWRLVAEQDGPGDDVIERVVFKHAAQDVYLVADAYRGARIKKAVADFFDAAAGDNMATLEVADQVLGLNGGADMVVYVGHNGLMDFDIAERSQAAPDGARQAIVLACKSKAYFRPRLAALGCRSVLMTTGFMAPEAYTLDAAVSAWIAGEPGETIRERAAAAYNKYQKCGLTGARRLFYSEE